MNYEKLREARRQKGYSQEELAVLCNVSRQAVSKWESGQSVPDADNLKLISQALEISIDYLLDNEDQKTSRVNMKFDYQDFMRQEEQFSTYEYKSKTEVFGIPLVHIHYTRGYFIHRYQRGFVRKSKVAKGIIAIGDIAIGVLSIGLMSMGIFSLGLLSAGLLGLAVFQLGLFSYGVIAVGFSSVGVIALGWYALGVIAVAKEIAVGICAIGDHAIGISAVGETMNIYLGKKNEAISLCDLGSQAVTSVEQLLGSRWIPFPLRRVVELLLRCR